jgi:hypothetical protein
MTGVLCLHDRRTVCARAVPMSTEPAYGRQCRFSMPTTYRIRVSSHTTHIHDAHRMRATQARTQTNTRAQRRPCIADVTCDVTWKRWPTRAMRWAPRCRWAFVAFPHGLPFLPDAACEHAKSCHGCAGTLPRLRRDLPARRCAARWAPTRLPRRMHPLQWERPRRAAHR